MDNEPDLYSTPTGAIGSRIGYIDAAWGSQEAQLDGHWTSAQLRQIAYHMDGLVRLEIWEPPPRKTVANVLPAYITKTDLTKALEEHLTNRNAFLENLELEYAKPNVDGQLKTNQPIRISGAWEGIYAPGPTPASSLLCRFFALFSRSTPPCP